VRRQLAALDGLAAALPGWSRKSRKSRGRNLPTVYTGPASPKDARLLFADVFQGVELATVNLAAQGTLALLADWTGAHGRRWTYAELSSVAATPAGTLRDHVRSLVAAGLLLVTQHPGSVQGHHYKVAQPWELERSHPPGGQLETAHGSTRTARLAILARHLGRQTGRQHHAWRRVRTVSDDPDPWAIVGLAAAGDTSAGDTVAARWMATLQRWRTDGILPPVKLREREIREVLPLVWARRDGYTRDVIEEREHWEAAGRLSERLRVPRDELGLLMLAPPEERARWVERTREAIEALGDGDGDAWRRADLSRELARCEADPEACYRLPGALRRTTLDAV
jgi:hypothetical protein